MNKLLVVSDSHGLNGELQKIRHRHRDVDNAIHCGDSELPENASALQGYRVVKGNCDWSADFPEVTQMEVGDLNIVITHGHLYDVKSSMTTIEYLGMEKEADIVCFGHSHIPYAEAAEKCLFLNPGSIRLPKKYPDASYAIIEWDHPTEVNVRFYEVDGREITYLPYKQQFNLR